MNQNELQDYQLFDVSVTSIPKISVLIDEVSELVIKLIAVTVVLSTAAFAGITEIKRARDKSARSTGSNPGCDTDYDLQV